MGIDDNNIKSNNVNRNMNTINNEEIKASENKNKNVNDRYYNYLKNRISGRTSTKNNDTTTTTNNNEYNSLNGEAKKEGFKTIIKNQNTERQEKEQIKKLNMKARLSKNVLSRIKLKKNNTKLPIFDPNLDKEHENSNKHEERKSNSRRSGIMGFQKLEHGKDIN